MFNLFCNGADLAIISANCHNQSIERVDEVAKIECRSIKAQFFISAALGCINKFGDEFCVWAARFLAAE